MDLYEESANTGDYASERLNDGRLEDKDSHHITEIGEREKDGALDTKTVEDSGESLSTDDNQKEEAHIDILIRRFYTKDK